jgi:hypothetical protein
MRTEFGKFSYFEGGISNTTPRGVLSVGELGLFVTQLATRLYHHVEAGDIEAYKKSKLSLDYITPAGVFTTRNNNSIVSVSRLFTIDIDENHLPFGQTAEQVFERLKSCEYVRFMAYSPSGRGLWILVAYSIDLIKDIVAAGNVKALENKLKLIVTAFGRNVLERQYGIFYDACSTVLSQPRVLARSKDCYYNENSEEWCGCLDDTPELALNNKRTAYEKAEPDHAGDHDANMKALLELADIARARRIDIFCHGIGTGYHDWQRAAMAIAATYGEAGRELFERLSDLRGEDTQAANHHLVQKKYDDALRNSRGSVSIATLFWLFKHALGEDVFYSVLKKHKASRKSIQLTNFLRDKTELIERVKASLRDGRYGVREVTTEALALIVAVVEDLIENEIVLCLDNGYLYKFNRDRKKWMPILRTDDGGEDRIKSTLFNQMNVLNIKVKASYIANSILPYTIAVIEHMLGKRLYEIARANADIDLDNIMQYKPKYTIDDLLSNLKIAYSPACQRTDVKKAFVEFFAGLANVLFKPLTADRWTGADRVLVLVGDAGVGKTYFAKRIIKEVTDVVLPNDLGIVYQGHLRRVDDDERNIFSKMRDSLLLVLDDVKESTLNSPEMRDLVTTTGERMRRLYTNASDFVFRFAHLIATTNHKQIIREVQHNRRFFPLLVSASKLKNEKFFNHTDDFNALDLLIDAMQIVEREYAGNFGALKEEMDMVTFRSSQEYSADGDVAAQIAGEYYIVDVETLKQKARSNSLYANLLMSLKLSTMRELRNELQLDKKTISAALESIGVRPLEQAGSCVKINGKVKRLYGYPLIRQSTLIELGADFKKPDEFPDVFKLIEYGTSVEVEVAGCLAQTDADGDEESIPF